MPPSSVEGVILLGWMERDFAIKYLRDECVFDPQLSEAQAEEIWRRYRDTVEALPPRQIVSPPRLPLTLDDERRIADFNRFHGLPQRRGAIREVIKINPLDLVTHQPYVCLERARQHLAGAQAVDTLATQLRPQQIRIRHGMNMADVDVPHGEFAFGYNPQVQQFFISETGRHVSVTEYQQRMILWAGYHRSYACMIRENPEGIERSMLVALTTDADFFVSEQSPNQGLRAIVCGLRPPHFRDFFDERFFMTVRLRKKRYELQVRANCVPVNFD